MRFNRKQMRFNSPFAANRAYVNTLLAKLHSIIYFDELSNLSKRIALRKFF